MQNADFTEKKRNFIKHKNVLSDIKMGKEVLTFDIIEIEKKKFCRDKTAIFLKDVDIEKVLVSNKISFGEKTISTLLVVCIMIINLRHCI